MKSLGGIPIDQGSEASSPAIASDGTIYVGSNDQRLYALKPDGTKKEVDTGLRFGWGPVGRI